jgi:hypothetical protein
MRTLRTLLLIPLVVLSAFFLFGYVRAVIRDPSFRDATGVLLELGSRGENLGQELSLVLDRLSSTQQEIRSRAWHALQVAYPSCAKLVGDFRVEDAPEQCKQKVDKLRDAEPGAARMAAPPRSLAIWEPHRGRHR